MLDLSLKKFHALRSYNKNPLEVTPLFKNLYFSPAQVAFNKINSYSQSGSESNYNEDQCVDRWEKIAGKIMDETLETPVEDSRSRYITS